MKYLIVMILSVAAAINACSQTSLFSYGSAWKYKDDGSNQGTAWRATSFNDTPWSSGNAELGYGDGDETTVVNACGTVTQYPSCSNKYITTYFRKTINIPNVNAFANYLFNFKRDDGIIIYINGTEIYRENMPSGTVDNTTLSSTNCSDDGTTIFNTKFSVAASKLVSGKNVIAVEIHQTSGSSSDISFNMEMLGELAGAGAVITRGPYIQKVTPTSATLRWRTDASVDSRVKFGLDTGSMLKDTVLVTGTRTEHTVTINGLQPYTKYYYTIGTSAGVIQGGTDNYFVTTPTSGTTGKYTFWVAGDCGNNSTNQQQVVTQYNNYIGNSITNGWLLLGDNAYNSGTDAEFGSNFFNMYQTTIMRHAPLWPVPGNHDYANDATRQDDHNVPYYSIFDVPSNAESGGVASNTKAFYSYDYGNVHFLALDSYGEESNLRLYDTLGAQVTWIKKDLAANKLPWVIAYWHHPPYTMASHNSDSEGELVSMRTNFIQILERYGVDMILCGHSHGYERSKLMKGYYGNEASFNAATHNVSQSSAIYDGTANSCPYVKDSSAHKTGAVYVVAGSSGQLGGTQSTYPHNAMLTSDVTHGGSLILSVDGSRLDVKWLCADGVIRDKFTMMKEAGKNKTYQLNLGDTVVLNASWNGNYKWSHSTETTRTVVTKPQNTSTYITKDQYQCLSDTFKVTVIKPTVSIGNINTAWCAGASINVPFTITGNFLDGNRFIAQLSDASGSFNSPVTIGQLTSKTSGTVAATLPASGNIPDGAGYRIRIISTTPAITDPNAVTNTFSYTNYLPVVSLTVNDADKTICKGDRMTFSATGALSYQFFLNGNAVGAPGANNTWISDSLRNRPVITVTGTNTCGADTATVSMTVINPPSTTLVSNDQDNAICQGESLSFTATGADAYEFFVGNTSYGYGTRNTFSTAAISDQQKVKVTGYNVCGSDSSQHITITVNPIPNVILTCSDADRTILENEQVTFTASGAGKYEFYMNGQSQGAPSAVSQYTTTTIQNGQAVYAKGITTPGCSASSNAITMKVNKHVSVNFITAANGHSMVYPNPYRTGNSLTLKYHLDNNSTVTVEMTDINGKLVAGPFVQQQQGGDYEYPLPLQHNNLTKGVYFIKVITAFYTDTIKLSVLDNE